MGFNVKPEEFGGYSGGLHVSESELPCPEDPTDDSFSGLASFGTSLFELAGGHVPGVPDEADGCR